MTADRIDLQLRVLGATHTAESVIALLNGASRSLSSHSRDGFHDAMNDVVTMAWALIKSAETMREDNWNARCAEIDAGRIPTLRREHA